MPTLDVIINAEDFAEAMRDLVAEVAKMGPMPGHLRERVDQLFDDITRADEPEIFRTEFVGGEIRLVPAGALLALIATLRAHQPAPVAPKWLRFWKS